MDGAPDLQTTSMDLRQRLSFERLEAGAATTAYNLGNGCGFSVSEVTDAANAVAHSVAHPGVVIIMQRATRRIRWTRTRSESGWCCSMRTWNRSSDAVLHNYKKY